jgi:predicted  nucleic acid-binding Zn-ribbon protein
MTIEIALLISIISVVFSVYFGMKNNKRSDTKEIEARVMNDTKINAKLDNISLTMQDVKTEISTMREDLKAYNERLIKVEESCKQAQHRLDLLETRFNRKED